MHTVNGIVRGEPTLVYVLIAGLGRPMALSWSARVKRKVSKVP
jgi:hypothetical protein